jgi:hypothetical protein
MLGWMRMFTTMSLWGTVAAVMGKGAGQAAATLQAQCSDFCWWFQL